MWTSRAREDAHGADCDAFVGHDQQFGTKHHERKRQRLNVVHENATPAVCILTRRGELGVVSRREP
jgi:hypothetical protein